MRRTNPVSGKPAATTTRVIRGRKSGIAEVAMRGRVVLVAGIVLFAALLSYLVALPSRTAQSMDPCFTNAVVRRNGDVVLDEKVYSNQAALKARITDLKSRKPDCFVSVTSEKG